MDDKTKGLCWIIVALNDKEGENKDLCEALTIMLNDEKFKQLYDNTQSYVKTMDKTELLNAIN